MAFIKRLGYYLVGLSIGLIFLSIFLRKKSEETGTSFCYLPNCRVLKDLRSKPLLYSEEIKAMLANKTIDSTTVSNFLNNGDVNFSESDTEGKPCKTYIIEGKVKEKGAILTVKNCSSKVSIESFKLAEN